MPTEEELQAAMIAHEEAHATLARANGWEVTEIRYSKRGGSGQAHYLAPTSDLGTWRELCVTLAGIVSDTNEFGDDIEVHIGKILRKTRTNRQGLHPSARKRPLEGRPHPHDDHR